MSKTNFKKSNGNAMLHSDVTQYNPSFKLSFKYIHNSFDKLKVLICCIKNVLILHNNICSINMNFSYVVDILENFKFLLDFIILTETWGLC